MGGKMLMLLLMHLVIIILPEIVLSKSAQNIVLQTEDVFSTVYDGEYLAGKRAEEDDFNEKDSSAVQDQDVVDEQEMLNENVNKMEHQKDEKARIEEEDKKDEREEDAEEKIEDKEKQLISIAEHLRSDPTIVSEFKPSSLRAVVNNPRSLSILPLEVLDLLINDPIFKIHLPHDDAMKVTELISNMVQEAKDLPKKVKADYDDYDLDLYDIDLDDLDSNVNSFIGDLSSDFLKSLNPDLIVSYFENASPNDLKEILSNSSILASLPASTIGSLMGKLNQTLLITLLNSPAVRDLYNHTARNLTQDEKTMLNEWQAEVVEQIILQVNTSVLESIPEFLVKGQLNNKRALAALINHKDKLKAVLKAHPSVLDQIPTDVVTDMVANDFNVLKEAPIEIFNHLATCQVVKKLSYKYSAYELITGSTDKFVKLFLEKPNIVDCVADKSASDFVMKIFDDAAWLDELNGQTSGHGLVEQLSRAVSRLPRSGLVRLANLPGMLTHLPDNVVLDMVKDQPDLVERISGSAIVDLAKTKPWLIGSFPMSAARVLASRPDIVSALSDRDFANLIAFQPKLISLLTAQPSLQVTRFLLAHLGLFDMMPPVAKPYIVKALRDKNVMRKIPEEVHVLLAEKPLVIEYLDKQSIIDILNVYPRIISRLSKQLLKSISGRNLKDPWFRERIPCETIRTAAKRPDILDLFSDRILSIVMTSEHILSCVSKKDVERVLAESRIGSRLPLSTLVSSARSLRISQMSLKMVVNFITKQMPQSNTHLMFS